MIGVWPLELIEAKAGDDPGTIEGYASVFGVVDEQDEVVMPGAFKRTLKAFKDAGRRIPLTADHQMSSEGVIGSAEAAEETAKGLKVKFRFSSDERAQALRAKARDGHLNGLSIFGSVTKSDPPKYSDGRLIKALREIKLLAVGLTPFPANLQANATAKAVTDRQWDGSAGRFNAEQWRRSTLIDTGEGGTDSKARYKLPVREPDGTINRNAVAAAAAALAGARGGIEATDAQKRSAARSLVRIYRSDLDQDPPEGLLQLAGMSSSSLTFEEFAPAMRQALQIGHETAMKAAVNELVGAYVPDDPDPEVDDETSTGEGDDTGDNGDTSKANDAAAYALAIANGGEPDPRSDDGALGGNPGNDSLAESLVTRHDVDKAMSDADRLANEIGKELEE